MYGVYVVHIVIENPNYISSNASSRIAKDTARLRILVKIENQGFRVVEYRAVDTAPYKPILKDVI